MTTRMKAYHAVGVWILLLIAAPNVIISPWQWVVFWLLLFVTTMLQPRFYRWVFKRK